MRSVTKKVFISCALSFFGGGLSFSFADNVTFPTVQSEYVYQGSSLQNLKSLKPLPSTQGKNWVIAMPDMAIAAGFIVNAGDFNFCWSIDDDGIFSITERYKGAFDLCKRATGSIYKLSSNGFVFHQTGWDPEVVNAQEVFVLEEFPISDIYEVLKQLEADGRLKLYYYPTRPSGIPVDDSDIIRKAVLWTRGNFPSAGKEFLQLHPHLKDRFETALKAPALPE
jgi:hypothetical protein